MFESKKREEAQFLAITKQLTSSLRSILKQIPQQWAVAAGKVSGETQPVMGARADPKGEPQGGNYNAANVQMLEMDKRHMET